MQTPLHCTGTWHFMLSSASFRRNFNRTRRSDINAVNPMTAKQCDVLAVKTQANARAVPPAVVRSRNQ
jgi:hypothetical protein